MKKSILFIILLSILYLMPLKSKAIVGSTGIHDPSTIIERNGVYHTWGTGDQIYHLTSTDLIRWSSGPTVFARGTWPKWIETYVSGFKGTFWAPECIFMNGQYYMYYSCSMGDKPCAIGVATSTDLETWTDQGMVVYSDYSSTHGSIDPAIFKATNGDYYLAFGSHLRGIWITPIDSVSGKRKNTTLTNVAGNGTSWCENEAAYVLYNDGYYYLFYNVGTCCNGISSTYNVRMGRSTSPTGPYLDRTGKDMKSGGGSSALSTAGKYIGPGHFGVFRHGDRNVLTLHYYDGTSNGTPRLDVTNLEFDVNGWPLVNRNILANGKYWVTNANSGLVWDTDGCTGVAGQSIIQNTLNTSSECQQWNITSLGNGIYLCRNNFDIGKNQVIEIPACNTASKLATNDWVNDDCQKFTIEQHANGSYIFNSVSALGKVITVPGGSKNPGDQLMVLGYNADPRGLWNLTQVNESGKNNLDIGGNPFLSIYPNPSFDGEFTLNFSDQNPFSGTLEITNLEGKVLLSQKFSNLHVITIQTRLPKGMYLLHAFDKTKSMVEKLVVSE